ncbi:hypothetical protein CHU98_g106 [Xylaria longipes]|nr:hypothetical protein CHU98_g106 [Xylaria longipes]
MVQVLPGTKVGCTVRGLCGPLSDDYRDFVWYPAQQDTQLASNCLTDVLDQHAGTTSSVAIGRVALITLASVSPAIPAESHSQNDSVPKGTDHVCQVVDSGLRVSRFSFDDVQDNNCQDRKDLARWGSYQLHTTEYLRIYSNS